LPGRGNLGQRVVRVSADVRDLHDPAFERHPPGDAFAAGDNGSLAQGRPILGIRWRVRHIAVDLALAYRDPGDITAAKPRGCFDQCVQHRLNVGGRAAYDLEHIAGRGLVFERFFEVACAGLQFAEQSRILDRNDRLVGKGAHQFDLPLGERLDSIPRQINRAEHGALAQQWHPKAGASPGRHDLGQREVRVSAEVRDVHDIAFERDPPDDAVATGDNYLLAAHRP